jgi:hypothetical protein
MMANQSLIRELRCKPPGFRKRLETKCFCTWDIGQPLLMERAE